MSWITILAVYFVVWWTILFAVLPWGVRTQEEEGQVVPGSASSAPARPMLVKKAIATSIVSAIIVFLFWLAGDYFGLSLAGIADYFSLKPQ